MDSTEAPPAIAVIGIAGRFPGAPDVHALWRNLRDGVDAVTRFTVDELIAAGVAPVDARDPAYVKARGVIDEDDRFDAALFGMSSREAELTDPQQRVWLECALTAIEDAGYDPRRYRGLIGVFAGAASPEYLQRYREAGVARDPLLDFQLTVGNDKDFLATRTSFKLGLRGPSLTVQTACSTSLVAVCLACQQLLAGQCDLALAGGVSLSVPSRAGYWYREGMILAPDGRCRAFDASAQGTVPGDGVGAVVLKRLAEALADGDAIYAVIRGVAVNNDGHEKSGFTAPSVRGQAEVIAQALAFAEIGPEQISYVEAHGTGTPLGDPIEVAALDEVFRAGGRRSRPCAIGSIKTSVGHLNVAAGVAGLIKTVLALHHRAIPPSLHFERANPQIDLSGDPFFVATELTPWGGEETRYAGVSAFGVGGTNAHVVLSSAPAGISGPARPRAQALPLSAATEAALHRAERALAAHLAEGATPLADAAYTLQIGRAERRHRRVVIAESTAEAALAFEIDGAPSPAVSAEPSVAFLFPGQGAQYPAMAAELLRDEPIFRAAFERCAAILDPRARLTLTDRLATGSASALDETQHVQPLLFAVEYALATLLQHLGVTPAVLLGHSLGEYVAACVAGVFSLEDALLLVGMRGRLMQETAPGAMLSVPLAEADLVPLLGPDLDLAAVNGPARCVASGAAVEIEALERRLRARGVEGRRLRTTRAFHARSMNPILASFGATLARVAMQAPKIPLLSSVTGTLITDAEATDPAYWTRQLRDTVRFGDAIGRAFAGASVLVEVGPGETLRALVERDARRPAGTALIATMRRPDERASDRGKLLRALGELWCRGVPVRWQALGAGEPRRRAHLPTYPFERQRYWLLPAASSVAAPPIVARTDADDPRRWLHVPVFQPTPRLAGGAPIARWLVFADDGGIGAALALELGDRTILVRAGVGFARLGDRSFAVHPARRADFDALLAALAPTPCDGIVHAFALDSRGGLDALEGDIALGFSSVMALTQALGARGGADVHLALVTRGALAAGVAPTHPEQATLTGLCRVIPAEYPQIACAQIDLDATPAGDDAMVRALAAELAARTTGVVALRGRARLSPGHAPLVAPPRPIATLRRGGVYLITGGLGGLGLAFAGHLARTHQAKLVLVGRRTPGRDNDDASPADRALAQQLLGLARSGAEVLVHRADVADATEARALVAATRARFGAIHGVIHAAGVMGGGAIQRRTPDESWKILAPKLSGTLALDAALQDTPLDFFVLCSSLTALLGGFGQADYCAANCFLGAFAQQQHARGGRVVTAIDWDGWQEIGAAAEAARREDRAIGDYLLPPEGLALFDRAVEAGCAQILTSKRDLASRLAAPTSPIRIAARDAGARHPRPSLPVAYVAPRDEMEIALAEIWGEQLGIAGVGARDDFFALGGDSLLAVQVEHLIRHRLQLPIAAHALLEHPTLETLAARLVAGERPGGLAQPLVRLSAGAPDHAPLFLVHPVGGHVYFYAPLARALGAALPVYGVQAQGTLGEAPPLARVEDMAESYATAILAHQPEGPYRLGGSSFGGMVAFEIARRLVARGHEVSFLALIDTPGPQSIVGKLVDDAEILAYLLARGERDTGHHARLVALSTQDQLRYFVSHGGADERLPPESTIDGVRHFLRLFRANLEALFQYRPEPYPGDVHFFRAVEPDGFHLPDLAHFWAPVARSVEVIDVPGNHITMNLPPNVDRLAARLSAALAATNHVPR